MGVIEAGSRDLRTGLEGEEAERELEMFLRKTRQQKKRSIKLNSELTSELAKPDPSSSSLSISS